MAFSLPGTQLVKTRHTLTLRPGPLISIAQLQAVRIFVGHTDIAVAMHYKDYRALQWVIKRAELSGRQPAWKEDLYIKQSDIFLTPVDDGVLIEYPNEILVVDIP